MTNNDTTGTTQINDNDVIEINDDFELEDDFELDDEFELDDDYIFDEHEIQEEINEAVKRIIEEEKVEETTPIDNYDYECEEDSPKLTIAYQKVEEARLKKEKEMKKMEKKTNEKGCLSFMIAFWFRTAVLSIAIYLVSQFLSSLGNNDYVINRQSKVGVPMFKTIEDYTEEEINEVVLTAMNKNIYLTQEEKEIVYELKNIISDNPYLDKEKAEKQLSEIEIEYTNKDDQFGEQVVGVYDYNTNTIKMFSDIDKTEKRNVAHELVHGIFYNETTAQIPSFMQEGTTQILVDEYLSDVPSYEESTYPYEVTAVKLLCEMTDSDTVLKAYTTGDMSGIKNKLAMTIGIEKANEFIINLDNVFKASQSGKNVDLEELASVIRIADDFYLAKNSNIEDLEAYSYYRGILQHLGTKEKKVELNIYLAEKGIYVKPYFSNKLKKNFDKPYYYDYNAASIIRNGREAKEYIKY